MVSPHLKLQNPAFHDFLMGEVTPCDLFSVEGDLLHVTVFVADARRLDFKGLAVAETHLHIRQIGGPQHVLVAARTDGIEAHDAEDVPGRHLPAVVVAAEAVDVVLVEAVHDLAQPVLGLVRL